MVLKSCSLLTALVFAIIGFAYFRADIKVLALLIIFFCFFVLIPGYAILKRFELQGEHLSTAFSRSFFTGFAFNIALYYLSAVIGTTLVLWIVGPVLSAVCLYQATASSRKGDNSSFAASSNGSAGIGKVIIKAFRELPAGFFVFTAFVFVYSMCATQFSYISPEHSAFAQIKLDFGYHAGIINALASGFPPQDPWVNGITIQYHYYSEMLLSIPVRLFGLPSEEVLLSGTPYFITPVLSISLYAFFREFTKRKDLIGLYCLAFHFSNMFMLKTFPNSWFLYHIYSNINNGGLGIACMLTIIPVLKEWDMGSDAPENRYNTKEMLLFGILVMLLTGIKGPMSIVLVSSLVGTLLVGLLLRKVDMRSAAVTLLSIISFVLIYVFVIGSQHENATGGSLINVGEVTDIFFLKGRIMEALAGLPQIVKWGVLMAAFVITFLMAFIVPFIVGYIRELVLVISGRKEFFFSKVTVYACCLVGFISMMLLNFAGHSQVYLGFVTCALVPVICYWYFEDMHGRNSKFGKVVLGVFGICLFVSAYSMAVYTYNSCSNAADFYSSHDENLNKYRNVSTLEYEGLEWIKENTEEDDLIACDRFNSVAMKEYEVTKRSNNTHFAYAIYSDRHYYLEGSGFTLNADDIAIRREMLRNNNMLYDPENAERGDLARKLSVDYLIVSKRYNKVGSLENEDYELCFTNPEMDIYEIKDAS